MSTRPSGYRALFLTLLLEPVSSQHIQVSWTYCGSDIRGFSAYSYALGVRAVSFNSLLVLSAERGLWNVIKLASTPPGYCGRSDRFFRRRNRSGDPLRRPSIAAAAPAVRSAPWRRSSTISCLAFSAVCREEAGNCVRETLSGPCVFRGERMRKGE